MTTIEQRMKERAESRPDEYTNAWWRRQFEEVATGYRGINHACNCVLAVQEDLQSEVKELRKLVEKQEAKLTLAQSAIGQLQDEMSGLKESYKKAREAYKALKENSDG